MLWLVPWWVVAGAWGPRRVIADELGFIRCPAARLGHNLASFASPSRAERQQEEALHPVVAGLAYVTRLEALRLIGAWIF